MIRFRPVRGGFSILEMLIVVVILGLLATAAIPRFQSVQRRAERARLVASLHAAAILQHEFHADSSRWATVDELLAYTGGTTTGTFDAPDAIWSYQVSDAWGKGVGMFALPSDGNVTMAVGSQKHPEFACQIRMGNSVNAGPEGWITCAKWDETAGRWIRELDGERVSFD
jgi:prepilin-type N-terminal cleavage/methylation domain-containing protein